MNAYSIQSSFNMLVLNNLPTIGGAAVAKEHVVFAAPDLFEDLDDFHISLEYENSRAPYEVMGWAVGSDDMGNAVEGTPYIVDCLVSGWVSNVKRTWYEQLLQFENWLRSLVGENKRVEVSDYTTKPATPHASLADWQKPFAIFELMQPTDRPLRLPAGVKPDLQTMQYLVPLEGWVIWP